MSERDGDAGGRVSIGMADGEGGAAETPGEDTAPEAETAAAIAPRRSPDRRVILAQRREAGGGEEWMMTYMDTVTLLVTLFVLLLSFATIDKEKFEAVAHGLSLGKYGAGILMGSIGVSKKEAAPVAVAPAPVIPAEEPEAPPEPEPRTDLAAEISRSIDEQGLAGMVEVTARADVIDLQLNERVLFEAGRAALTSQGASVVARVAPILTTRPYEVSVEGHTDNVPISTERFPSNWELSGARAASVARALIGSGVAPDRVRIVGFADTEPVAPNDTPQGRQQNRRVNLLLHVTEDTVHDAPDLNGGSG